MLERIRNEKIHQMVGENDRGGGGRDGRQRNPIKVRSYARTTQKFKRGNLKSQKFGGEFKWNGTLKEERIGQK